MKRLILFLVSMIPIFANADPWSSAKSRNAGNYVETYTKTVTTFTATEIIEANIAVKSANIDIYANNAFTLWVGTNTTTLQTTGFPIESSNTYTTDGTFTGSLYGMADSAAGGNTNIRVIYYLKTDALR